MKIDGRKIAQNTFNKLLPRVKSLKKKGITPHLAIILIGDDPASAVYVRRKRLRAKEIGIETTIKRFSANISQKELLTTIQQPARNASKRDAGGFNNNNNFHGVIVQRPLPAHIDTNVIAKAIDPQKDVDGFHPQSKFPMPLAEAVIQILKYIASLQGQALRGWIKNKKIVVIGKGETGGRPIISMLRAKLGVQPLIIDSKTVNSSLITKSADIIISAVGKPDVIKPTMIKKDVVLIGVGLNRGVDGKLHGDYDEQNIKDIASFYTPTPYGVGPVNVALLLKNLVEAAENQF